MCINTCLYNQFISILNASHPDLSCYPCASTCLTCVNVSYNCTSCTVLPPKYLYVSTNKCMTDCPPEYY
jgi:hypothetical protein